MTARCRICASAARASVDAALVAGEAKRSIAKRLRLSASSVDRHSKHFASLPSLRSEAETKRERSILERVRELGEEARNQFALAVAEMRRVRKLHEVAGDDAIVSPADALREMGRVLELEARITGAMAPKKVEHTVRDMSPTEQLAEVIKLEKEIAAERARLEAEGRTIQ